MLPVFSREVVEREQHIAILGQTFTGHGVLGLVFFQEGVERLRGVLARIGHPDLVDVGLGPGLHALGHVVQHVGGLVKPAALFAGFAVNLAQCRRLARSDSASLSAEKQR
jgi:hypothetical protein